MARASLTTACSSHTRDEQPKANPISQNFGAGLLDDDDDEDDLEDAEDKSYG